MRVFERGHRYDESFSFKTWIFAVTSNLCSDANRASGRAKQDTLPADDFLEDLSRRDALSDLEWAEEDQKKQESIQRMVNCRDGLSERDREIIKLYYWDNLSDPEIAKQLGVTDGSIRGQRYRAIKRLSACMGSFA